MFYLFLFILSFVEFYLFRLLNQMLFRGAEFSGDILFAIFGVVISILFLEGMIHVKHLNKKWIKNLSFALAIVAILYFLASCISFNFNYIVSSLEISIILIVASFFLYRYQTAPEGEPDVEDFIEEETEDYPVYYEQDSVFDDSYSYDNYEPFIEPYVDENLSELNDILGSIVENAYDENTDSQIMKIKNLTESISNANSEYREENLDNLIYIFKQYNDELENDRNSEIVKLINDSLNFINSNLENIYYNTRGAQVFKAEQDVKALKERLEKMKN